MQMQKTAVGDSDFSRRSEQKLGAIPGNQKDLEHQESVDWIGWKYDPPCYRGKTVACLLPLMEREKKRLKMNE